METETPTPWVGFFLAFGRDLSSHGGFKIPGRSDGVAKWHSTGEEKEIVSRIFI